MPTLILAIGIRLPRLAGIEQPLILDDVVLEWGGVQIRRAEGDVIMENSSLVTSALSGPCGREQSYAGHMYSYLVNLGL